MNILEILTIIFAVLNKIAVVGIATWAVWALQTLFSDPEWSKAYPFLGKWYVRLCIALIAAGFAIDALSVYVPSVSEVVMNFGIFILMHLFRIQYKRNHPVIEALKKNQKQRI